MQFSRLRNTKLKFFLVFVISLVTSFGICFGVAFSILHEIEKARFDQLGVATTQTIRDQLLSGQTDEALKSLLPLVPAFLDQFDIRNLETQEQLKVPPRLELTELMSVTIITKNLVQSYKGGPTVFEIEFSRRDSSSMFTAGWLALCMSLLISVGSLLLRRRAVEEAKAETQRQIGRSLFDLASQVAHDIRSPLSALATVEKVSSGLTAPQRQLLQKSVKRINEIAGDLLRHHRGLAPSTAPKSCLSLAAVFDELQGVIEERRANRSESQGQLLSHFESLPIQRFGIDQMNMTDLMRSVSNLIGNALDATSNLGQVMVTCKIIDQSLIIEITDEGNGFSKESLANFLSGKVTSTKLTGNGLGLKFASQVIQEAAGQLRIMNGYMGGACVTIVLPLTSSEGFAIGPANAI